MSENNLFGSKIKKTTPNSNSYKVNQNISHIVSEREGNFHSGREPCCAWASLAAQSPHDLGRGRAGSWDAGASVGWSDVHTQSAWAPAWHVVVEVEATDLVVRDKDDRF